MDFEQLIPLIVIFLGLIFSVFRRKKQSDQATETANQADVNPEEEFGIPPFLEFEDPTEEQMVFEEESVPVMVEESETVVETPQEPKETEPPPIPPEVRGRTPTGIRRFPTTSLIDVSPETFRQGIILSEILGKPKTVRRRR